MKFQFLENFRKFYFFSFIFRYMARKKKEPTQTFEINVSKLSISQESLVDQMVQFISEHLQSKEITKDGKTVQVTVPVNITQKMLKLQLNKFIYQTGLKSEFRLISMQKDGKNGYQFMTR